LVRFTKQGAGGEISNLEVRAGKRRKVAKSKWDTWVAGFYLEGEQLL